MKLTQQRISERKTLFFHGEEDKRKAEITIQFVNDEGLKGTGEWEFVNCNFQPTKIPYTLDDWDFLAAINEEIKKLIK